MTLSAIRALVATLALAPFVSSVVARADEPVRSETPSAESATAEAPKSEPNYLRPGADP